MAKATIAGVSGGLASVATGGKFSYAAYSAAFFYLFNTQSGFWKKLTQGLDTLDAIAAAADFVPGVSTLKSGLEVITGYDPITGKALSAGDRWASAAGLVPGGKALKYAAKAVDALDTGHDIAKVAAKTATGAESAFQYQQLKASLSLQERLGSGKFVTNQALEIGQTRVAVFNQATGKMHLGSDLAGGHIGVVSEYGLTVSDDLIGGMIKVAPNGQMQFLPVSGSFPLPSMNAAGALDKIRGTGVSIIGGR